MLKNISHFENSDIIDYTNKYPSNKINIPLFVTING